MHALLERLVDLFATLPEGVRRWQQHGTMHEILGHEVFVYEEGQGETVLFLHGFPSSGYDWHSVVGGISSSRRVVVPDFMHFGFSAKPDSPEVSLFDQARMVCALTRQLGITDAHVVAHDMGTTVAAELCALRAQGALPFRLRSLSLLNGSVYQEMAHLTPSQKLLPHPFLGPLFARLANRLVFTVQLWKILGHPGAIDWSEISAMYALLRHRNGHLRLPVLSGYMRERRMWAHRWIPALQQLDVPVLILWGLRDPVAIAAIGQRLAREIPTARFVGLDTLGHYPQLEGPAEVGHALENFLRQVARETHNALSPAV